MSDFGIFVNAGLNEFTDRNVEWISLNRDARHVEIDMLSDVDSVYLAYEEIEAIYKAIQDRGEVDASE